MGRPLLAVHLMPSGRMIEPFGHGPDEAPILGRPWGELRREILAACGAAPAPGPPRPGRAALLVRDDVVFSRAYLAEFLRRARAGDRSVRAGLGPCRFLRDTLPLQRDTLEHEGGRGFLMFYLKDGRGDLDSPLPVLAVAPDELIHRVQFPPQYFGPEPVEVPLAARRILHLQLWVHLQRADQAALAGRHLELWRRRKLPFVRALLRARSRNKWRILAGLSEIHRSADVHPAAVVEASCVGPGVRIGAGAVVRASVLAEGASVADGAHVELSSLGPGAVVHKGGRVAFCTLYRHAATAVSLLQFSVLGERTILNTGSLCLDLNFKDEVRVMDGSELASCGSRYLGCAVGPAAVLGAGVMVAPGRAVPAGAVIVRPAAEILSRPPAAVDPGRLLAVRQGGLVPLQEEPA